MPVATAPEPITDSAWSDTARVPADLSCADWANEHFMLPPEASNTSGKWKTTTVQRAILNSMGNDAIAKVDMFKSARFGGSKCAVIANAYQTAHKRRNVGFYQPTKTDSDSFVKSEIEPSLRDCKPWHDLLLDKRDGSTNNTLSFKAFAGSASHYLGGHSANSFRRLTLDAVILDEIDGFNADVGGEGDAATLSWGRIKNSIFPSQILISTPTVAGASLIEKSSQAADDVLEYHAECPECGDHCPIEWGGPDCNYGFKWDKGKPETVKHYCKSCGVGWGNDKLGQAVDAGFWLGENGYKTFDGLEWFLNNEPALPPRHVSFKCWSALSPFSPWEQIIQEWQDANGDLAKMQAFTNTTLGRCWDFDHKGTITAQSVGEMIPVDDLSRVVLVTSGTDIQDDRHETLYMGHDQDNNVFILDYEIVYADMDSGETYGALASQILGRRFPCGDSQNMPITKAFFDTQGHHTTDVHAMLNANRKSGRLVGINGDGKAVYDINSKVSHSGGSKSKPFFSIGVNILKKKIYSAIINHDKESNGMRIAATATLPEDFGDQLTAERMVAKGGRMVFENKTARRNEALDCATYAYGAKLFIKVHGSYTEKKRFKATFGEG